MIGALKGVVELRQDPTIIIDVNGVGYRVLVPLSVSSKLDGLGSKIKLFTYTHVREDALELYGFAESEDLRVFEYLISVNGVGCRTALNVFSVGTRMDIMKAITSNDVNFFTSVPRLGKKNAQKIIIELKNKIGGEDIDLSADSGDNDEVIGALRSFGYSTKEAQSAISLLKGEGATVEEKIRLALKYLGK